MTQGNYVSEYTRDLMTKQRAAGGVPVLDLTNWQSPRYISGDSRMSSLIDLPTPHGACHSIEIKTTVDGKTDKCSIGVESSIIMCSGTDPATCGLAETSCPAGGTVSSTTFINMVAKFLMGAAQTGVEVTFKYVLNGVPKQEKVVVDVTSGPNVVYAFPTNVAYPADTTLVLYGAEVLA